MISTNIKAQRLIDKLAAMEKAQQPDSPEMNKAYHRIGMLLQARIVLKIREKLNKNSKGHLRNSIGYKVEKEGVKVFSSGVSYARIHEYGGTIRAKKKFLTIPLSREYENISAGKNRGRFFFITARDNRNYLIDKIAKRPAFILKESVKIPARPYFYPSVQESIPDIITILRQASVLS